VPGGLDLDVALVGSERCLQAGVLPLGEVLDAGAQNVADPVERILAAAVAVDVLLDPAPDLVDRGRAELDDAERVEHRDRILKLVVDVAVERVQSGDLDVLAERVAAGLEPGLVHLAGAARGPGPAPGVEVSVLVRSLPAVLPCTSYWQSTWTFGPLEASATGKARKQRSQYTAWLAEQRQPLQSGHFQSPHFVHWPVDSLVGTPRRTPHNLVPPRVGREPDWARRGDHGDCQLVVNHPSMLMSVSPVMSTSTATAGVVPRLRATTQQMWTLCLRSTVLRAPPPWSPP
jgi:hypothetical protein